MTRKHYILIARALLESRPDIEDHTTHSAVGDNTMVNSISFNAAYGAWLLTVKVIANALSDDNGLFDYDRFFQAAGA